MRLFDQRIPFRGERPGAATQLAAVATTAPTGEQATADAPRRGRWRNRSVSARSLAADLKPATISAAFTSADQGSPGDLFTLLQGAGDRDPKLGALLGTRYRAVANASWEILPGGPTKRDAKHAAEVEAMLRQLPGLEAAFMDLMQSVSTGFAAVEIIWEMRAGVAVPAELKYRPPRWFKPDPEDPNVWRLLSAEDMIDGELLLPNKWITHAARAKSGFPVQAGLGRPLLWWYLFKRFAIVDWNRYGELFGSPFRLGKFDPNTATDEQIDDLEAALASIGVDAYAAIPDTVAVDFVGDSASRSGPDIYSKMVDYCDECLAVGILGQSLTSGSQSKGGGSYALGQVHNSVRLDIRQADARELAASFTRGLIAPYVAFRYGPGVPVPQLRFKVEPPRDLKAEAAAQSTRADVYKKAGAMGLPVSRAQLYEDLKLRVPEGEDAVMLRGTSVPEGAPAEEPAEE